MPGAIPPDNQFLPLTGKGIVRCRDLVQLYYGARMATDVAEDAFDITQGAAPTQILKADSRRIKYEIQITITGGGGIVILGSPRAFAAGTPQNYALSGNMTVVVERDFLTDLDAVVGDLLCMSEFINAVITTRETFLTPLPVDEPVI